MPDKLVYNKFFSYHTGAFPLAEEGIKELKSCGHTNFENAYELCEYAAETLWVLDVESRKAIGVIVFGELRKGSFYILLAYVRADHRQRGLFRRMMQRLTEIAGDREIKRIGFGVSPGNTVMTKVAENIGAYAQYVTYNLPLSVNEVAGPLNDIAVADL